MKKLLLKLKVTVLVFTMIVSMQNSVKISSNSIDNPGGFYFSGGMTQEVLHNYLSRAVTFQGLCGEGPRSNLLIEEDIRFLLRTGTKFVGRAAMFAWNSTKPEDVVFHFSEAKKLTDRVHSKDPEIILQAFVAEIVRKSYVDQIEIPAWVFEAFGMEVENRNFRFSDIINKEKGENYWGFGAGYPDYSNVEARLWYYYCIRLYIDAGFESIHIQEGDDLSEYMYVEEILEMSREYARIHARRGLVLFHNFFSMFTGGNKIGDKLLFDIHGNGIVPIETVYENGAMKCKIGDFREKGNELQWIGRSAGGYHPLGFYVDACPTLLEFDNYGPDPQGLPGVSNGVAFYTWGYDDITWFAMQPDWYREEFLKYVHDYLKTHSFDNKQNQVYYCMYPARRVITPIGKLPERTYIKGGMYSTDFLFDYCDFSQENIEVRFNEDKSFLLRSKGFYRANNTSDGCPNGFNDENIIRFLFLGDKIPEKDELLNPVLPLGYFPDKNLSYPDSSEINSTVTSTIADSNSRSESRDVFASETESSKINLESDELESESSFEKSYENPESFQASNLISGNSSGIGSEDDVFSGRKYIAFLAVVGFILISGVIILAIKQKHFKILSKDSHNDDK